MAVLVALGDSLVQGGAEPRRERVDELVSSPPGEAAAVTGG